MALFIKEQPINQFNLIRWHEAQDISTDADRLEGFTRCSEFTLGCGEEVYAMPARPFDYVQFVANVDLALHIFPLTILADLALGIVHCCEFAELDDSDLTVISDGATRFIQGYVTMPDYEIGTQFNLCLYRIDTGEILYISNPYKIVSEEYAACETLRLISAQTGTLTINNVEYFPAAFTIENRIDASLKEMTPAIRKEVYQPLSGPIRTRNEVQTKQYTLSTAYMDMATHEALALYTGFPTNTFYSNYDFYAKEYRLAASGNYTIEGPVNSYFSLRSATVDFQQVNNIVSFRTC